ncbi:uncharacterized protein [Oscarella lobularis]|uniref:uncharacterized protein n=1 Tax=Oscarella lobularis TaxID=121494 RepID=UPI003313842B
MAEEADAASDSRSSTPQIPPGVVPSPSEEKLYNMMWRKAEESNESDVVRDIASSERESRRLSSTEPDPFELSRSESRMSPTIKGTPQRAWSDMEKSPLAKTIYVRSANEDLSDEDGKEVGVSTPPSQPKGRSTRRVTPIGHEISRPRRKEMERRVKNVIGTRENDDPELLKFREISSPESDKESEHSGVTDSHPVASTLKPATVEEEDHLYDDVFTEDEMTFVEKDWHVPGILDFSDYSKSELTPLHYAASLGKRRYLLELINAIRSQREPVFNLLTPDGKKHMLGDNSRISYSTMTDINCLDGCGRTALMHAVHWNRLGL